MNIRSQITDETELLVTQARQLSPTHIALAVKNDDGTHDADLFNASVEQIDAILSKNPSEASPVSVSVIPDSSDDLDSHPEVFSVN